LHLGSPRPAHAFPEIPSVSPNPSPMPSAPPSKEKPAPSADTAQVLAPDTWLAKAPEPGRADGSGSVAQPVPASSPDMTAWQPPMARVKSEELSRTVVQRLSDRVLSEASSLQKLAAGYKMVGQLGEGTYGTVWLATEENTGIQVAIKFFAHGTGQQWQMLQDEVKQLAALDGATGIVQLKDVVPDADPPYYVMSYAEGGSLAQRLQKGPIPLAEALRIFREVVQALAYVHAHGVRHCDLKPGNILLDRLGHALVADFGQAHLSNDATPALGTFFYMAPEQADLGRKIPDTRWDVYGLGALLYAMLTGHPPRKDDQLSNELDATEQLGHRLRRYREGIHNTPKPTAHHRVRGMDRRLARIIDGCLELDPKKRLPGAEAILRALQKRRVRRRQLPLLAFGLAAPLLVILLMSAFGWSLAKKQINNSGLMLTSQIFNSDEATARLAANGLGKGLKRKIDVLQGIRDADGGESMPRLVAAAAAARRKAAAGEPASEEELSRCRADLKRRLKDAAVGQLVKKYFYISALTVADREGYMLMAVSDEYGWESEPDFENTSREIKWAWRDWFSGEGNQGAEWSSHDPVKKPHISQPYKSKSDDKLRVDVTVPIYAPGVPDMPVGVLVGSMKWEDVSRWLNTLKVTNGMLSVFNERGQFLMHGNDQALLAEMGYHDDPVKYSDSLSTQLGGGRNSFPSYRDPIDDKEYLAGYATFDPYNDSPVKDDELDPGADGRWGVVIQRDKAMALEPVAALHNNLVSAGGWLLGSAAVMTVGIWAGLIWLLRREERVGHG
jgi:eukaryotic-like serine/threonine-protein kinase